MKSPDEKSLNDTIIEIFIQKVPLGSAVDLLPFHLSINHKLKALSGNCVEAAAGRVQSFSRFERSRLALRG